MTPEDLRQKTKKFALLTFRFIDALPKKWSTEIIARQLLRSATSVAANYRAACRARSKADFLAKISIVEEEADESLYWPEFLQEIQIGEKSQIAELLTEAKSLTAIFTASRNTLKHK